MNPKDFVFRRFKDAENKHKVQVVVDDVLKKCEIPFPKLMKEKGGKSIVLFRDYGHGTDLAEDVGKHSCNWNMDLFEDFYGTITLSN